MSAVAGPALPGATLTRRGGLYRDAFRRLRRNRAATASLALIAALVFVALFADLIAPYDPSRQFLEAPSGAAPADPLALRDTGKYEAPSAEHFFGTDQLARDIFSRTVYGLRISLAAAFFAIAIVTVIGVAVGMLAVAGPRPFDAVLMRATDVAYAFPDLLLIILLSAALGNEVLGFRSIAGVDASVWILFLAISLTAWPTMARLVRGQLLAIRETEYSQAARALGASQTRIATRHWLPNATGPLIVEATFLVPRAIFAEAALSFIGVGVNPPTPSLGVLIREHFDFVQITWTGLAFPAGILALLFLAFQFLGDGLRDALDPRSR
ncbi:MAG: ABC transporter permease subunit [Dehalococcoidia bacterium]|nr:ABC transporter permease subunit [Dehalococcoidia bacterium]